MSLMMSQLIAYLHSMYCFFQQKLILAKENMAIIQNLKIYWAVLNRWDKILVTTFLESDRSFAYIRITVS